MSRDELINQFLQERDAILGFIIAMTRDSAVAEDIFQEVARVILEEANKATPVANFRPWAREIARRRVAEFYRRHARTRARERPSPSLEEVIGQAFDENDSVLNTGHLRFKALLECLEGLANRSREVIDAFYLKRQPIREIAVALDWTENSVKTTLWRARKAMLECIQGKLRSWERD